MCFKRSRYWEERAWDERASDARGERLWDLFYRETERSEPPVPIAEREAEREPERDEVPAGAER